jgi:hypothetical protein
LSHLANARRVRPAYKLGRSSPFRIYNTCTYEPQFPLFAHAGGVWVWGPRAPLPVEPVQSVRGTQRVEPGGPGPLTAGCNFFLLSLLGTSVFRPEEDLPGPPYRTGKIIADTGECATRGTHGPSRIVVGRPRGLTRSWSYARARYLPRVAHNDMRDEP